MSNDPDKIRADIEATRAELSRNIDNLGEQVQPGNLARRQGKKVAGRFEDLKDQVFGSEDTGADRYDTDSFQYGTDRRAQAQRVAGDAKETAAHYADQAQEALQGAPSYARRKTKGSPVAAGMIALGAGWLLGSLLPSTDGERRLSADLKDRAQPLLEGAQAEAKRIGEELQPQAQAAFADVKDTAQSKVEDVKGSATSAAEEVKGSAKSAAQDVKAEGQSAAEDVKGSAKGAASNVQEQRKN